VNDDGGIGHNSSRTVPFEDLTALELEAWHELRARNPALDSPYYHPGFAEAVNRSGKDVQVVVAASPEGRVTSLLPCHRDGSRLRPVGWPGADLQGPILAPGSRFNPMAVLMGGVREYAFDHLVEVCPDFARWIESREPSPFLDVSGGLDGYLGRASRSGKEIMGQARRGANKTEQQHGPMRLTLDSTDFELLDQVIELKRAQYAATGSKDYFVDPSRRELLRILLQRRDRSFGGMLSAIHAGPHLLAAHFGLRAGSVLHWWFPVYNPTFAQLGPGKILLRQVVISAPELGIVRIDLGRGEEEYKRRVKTGETLVAQGMVTRGTGRRIVRRVQSSAITALKSSPLGPRLRKVAHAVRARSH
jgi:CelD/BcsL family acetyltransferase involved in cellulose biosynthesis